MRQYSHHCALRFFFISLVSIIYSGGLSAAAMPKTQKVVILGAGIHGASVAYYLTHQFGISPTIVERTAVAAAASGKSGGFLAREWGNGPTRELHQISFDMHEQLARDLAIESYRRINTLEVDGNRKGKNEASWLDRKVSSRLMDTATAQVTPLELTNKLIQASVEKGASIVYGNANGVVIEEGKVKAVKLAGQESIPADKVILCLGPWSGVMAEDWFGMTLPMEGVKSTSLVYSDLEPVRKEPVACFCAEDEYDCHLELYPRPNGEIYICGCGGSDYVSGDRLRAGGDCEHAVLIKEDPRRVAAASSSFRSMSSLGDKAPDSVQACMRPCPPDALPVMGPVPDVEGAYISAGHNCWGILWAPVSGLAMAQLMVLGESKVVDLKAFNPARFMERSSKRGKKMGDVNVGEQW